jgi:polyhydroxyalkanoate synthesis regulator protein
MTAEMYQGLITDLIARANGRVTDHEFSNGNALRRFIGGGRRMALKQEMEQQIRRQVEVWQAQINAHQEHMQNASQEAKANYENGIAQLKENAEQGQKLLNQVKQANEGAWQDMQQASLDSLERLQKGWADALKHFT